MSIAPSAGPTSIAPPIRPVHVRRPARHVRGHRLGRSRRRDGASRRRRDRRDHHCRTDRRVIARQGRRRTSSPAGSPVARRGTLRGHRPRRRRGPTLRSRHHRGRGDRLFPPPSHRRPAHPSRDPCHRAAAPHARPGRLRRPRHADGEHRRLGAGSPVRLAASVTGGAPGRPVDVAGRRAPAHPGADETVPFDRSRGGTALALDGPDPQPPGHGRDPQRRSDRLRLGGRPGAVVPEAGEATPGPAGDPAHDPRGRPIAVGFGRHRLP